jgi:hypothetical protein
MPQATPAYAPRAIGRSADRQERKARALKNARSRLRRLRYDQTVTTKAVWKPPLLDKHVNVSSAAGRAPASPSTRWRGRAPPTGSNATLATQTEMEPGEMSQPPEIRPPA